MSHPQQAPIPLLQPDNGVSWAQHHHAQKQNDKGQNVQNDRWNHSLWDCCGPCDLCLLSTFVPCLLLGQTSHRIQDPSMETYSPVNGNCVLMMGITYLTGCGWIYVMHKRFDIRQRYGIKGSDMGDCYASFWCLPSALVQHEREVIARQTRNHVNQGYQQQPRMQIPPAMYSHPTQ